MDPFPHDPYESDSGDEGFAWAGGGSGGAVSDARTLTEHAKALMRGDLEVSPLVTNVPPMPEYRPSAGANAVPGIPSTFRGGSPQLAPKKRKIDPQAVAHAFVGESQEVILPEPSGIPGASDRDPHRYFPTETASPSSVEQMKPPPPPGARGASQLQHPGTDMLAILTTAASQSTPLPGTVADPKSAPDIHEQSPPDAEEDKRASDGLSYNHAEAVRAGAEDAEAVGFQEGASASHPNNQEPVQSDAVTPDDATSKDSSAIKASAKAVKRKSVTRAAKKVLVAKKERDIADALLSDKADLLDVLPREDCFFLGEEFWIFTVPQLSAVLGVGAFASVIPDDKRTGILESLISKLSEETELLKDTHVAPVVSGEGQDGDSAHRSNSAAAKARVHDWTNKLVLGFEGKSVQDRFPLDGPVSCLFPKSARNFLASAKVKTLYEFLALKKTETGAICDFLKVWRRLCKLPELPMFSLAKHLIGISQRVESAIASDEPLDAKTRRWMIDPIVVLTGAAHDFLVGDQGIFTAAEFIDARTKELSLKLAEWREKNHMVPLKGSGKVAMISGWKAAAREALEAESHMGKILTNVDLAAVVALESPIENEETDSVASVGSAAISSTRTTLVKPTRNPKTNASKRKLTVSTQYRQVQYALNTKLFLHDVLGEPIALRLEQAGIMTAADFFEMSPETESTLRDLTLQAESTSSNESFDELIEEWNRKLNKELERMAPADPATSNEVVPPAKKARSADKRLLVERKPLEGSSKTSGRRTVGDPFESLSAVTKRFLATMDIGTAEDFLKTRTTDIATKFVEFRISEGMPELKGLGAIASVSGWKANVRKAARDMGKEDIVVMEPDNKSSWGPHSRNIIMKPRPVATSIPIANVVSVTEYDVLDGKPRVLFAVQGGSDREQRFRFDVALRRRDDSSPVTLFATYRGSVNYPSSICKKTQVLECGIGDSKSVWTCPIMDDVEYIKVGKGDIDSRSIFPASGQGTGLIFLSPYGVRPVASQDLRSLKSEIQGFVVDGKVKASTAVSKCDTKCNTITRQSPFGSAEHYLFIDKSMEKGQCVQVCFRTLSSLLQSVPFRNTPFQLRHLLVESLGLLSRSDLRQLLSYLEELLETIDFRGARSRVLAEASVDDSSRFKAACCSRRRLHWMATKVAITLQDWHVVASQQPDVMVPVNKNLYFGALLSQNEDTKDIPAALASDLRESICGEVKQELLAALDLDKICGSSARQDWCSLFSLTFQRFMDCILENYLDGQSPSADTVLLKLSSCLSSCVSVPLSENLGDVALSATSGDDFASQAFVDAEDQHRHDKQPVPDSTDGVAEFFACESPKEVDAECGAAGTSVVFCSRRNAVIEGTLRLSQRWYRERQWWIIMTLIAKAGTLLSYEERLTFMHPRALFELKSRFLKDTGLPTVEDPTMEMAGPVKLSSTEFPGYQPKSFSFFLGLVWPKLRVLGWRLEAGETPSTATFIAPDVKVIPTKRSNPWKQRRDVLRTRLARETNRTGLGNLTKVTKRVVISVIPHPDGDAAVSVPEESKGISTAEALQRFLLHVQDDLEDASTRDLAARVVELVKTCFDEMAPSMTPVVDVEGETPASVSSQEAGAPSDRLSCDYLLRFLLVLPSILRQSELPLQEINDCTEVVSQLVSWMTMKHASLFHKKFHPSKESYAPPKQPKQTPPDLSRRLKTLHSVTAAAAANGNNEPGSSSNALVMKELIRPEDKDGLTDFLVMVLDQAIPCRATEHDVAKKYRRVNVGYPGFVCRHCMGRSGEGRYFFSTIESLTTASTVFEKHVGKCKLVPDEVKAAVVDAKTRHVEQRKQLPVGSQQAYFNKLWDRLRSCQIEGTASGTYVLEGTAKKSSTDALHESTEEHEFRDHRDVLEFLNSRLPWKDHPVVLEALGKYYGFVEYGGRVYNTSSMPEHFSAEWLLRKVGPKPKISRKKRLMPG